MSNFNLYHGDCLLVLNTLEDNSIDSVVVDPPYGLSFMSSKWDVAVPSTNIWLEVFRVLKPGGHLVSFFGSRTYHRGVVNIEDAGFEIRDMICWSHSQGFPKNLNVSKEIDKQLGMESFTIGKRNHPTLKDKSKIDRKSTHQFHSKNNIKDEWDITSPQSKIGIKYNGTGTALKPALEPIVLARKPISEKNIALNVMKWGVGCLWIDRCRLTDNTLGRFPSNFIHDSSDEIINEFIDIGIRKSGNMKANTIRNCDGGYHGGFPTDRVGERDTYGDSGLIDRFYKSCTYSEDDDLDINPFYYCAKASTKDRNEGLDDHDSKKTGMSNGAQIHGDGYIKGQGIGLNRVRVVKNIFINKYK